MRHTIIFLGLSLMHYFTFAQTNRATLNLPIDNLKTAHSEAILLPLEAGDASFLSLFFIWSGEAEHLEMRFSADAINWGAWDHLHLDAHADQKAGRKISELYFANKTSRYIQIALNTGLQSLQMQCFNPGLSKKEATYTEPMDRNYCPCPQPAYQGRLDWCPDGSCPPDATPVYTTVTHLIVHHSATSNTAADWAAVVRSFWDFHVFGNGWDDIGYNWLVDPNGVLYEGRGDNLLGAHFSGVNGGTMGVCVIGDFTDVTPTVEAKAMLTQLLAWKACDVDIDPLGSAIHASSGLNLNRISGHRDGPLPTACPGDSFYPQLPEVRQSVADLISSACAAIAPPDDLTVTTASETQLNLNWVDESDNEMAFLIERSLSFNGDYEQIAETAANATSYEDEGLTPQTGYYYRIRSANVQDTSVYSNKAFGATIISGTHTPDQTTQIVVFPNPAKDKLFMELYFENTASIRLELLDASGRLLKNKDVPGKGRQEWAIGDLPTGIYWLKAVSGSAVSTIKVQVE